MKIYDHYIGGKSFVDGWPWKGQGFHEKRFLPTAVAVVKAC